MQSEPPSGLSPVNIHTLILVSPDRLRSRQRESQCIDKLNVYLTNVISYNHLLDCESEHNDDRKQEPGQELLINTKHVS